MLVYTKTGVGHLKKFLGFFFKSLHLTPDQKLVKEVQQVLPLKIKKNTPKCTF